MFRYIAAVAIAVVAISLLRGTVEMPKIEDNS